MEAAFQSSIIILAIVLNITGVLLSATYIAKIGLVLDAQKAYTSQIDACFLWSSILMFFGWLITTTGSDEMVQTGLKIAIILWLIIFTATIIFMLLHFTKKFRNENSVDYIFSLKDIGVRSLIFTFVSIFSYWIVF